MRDQRLTHTECGALRHRTVPQGAATQYSERTLSLLSPLVTEKYGTASVIFQRSAI